ncbi:MAG: glucose-6-phosphate isomerase [Pseudomonadota bacterium]
MLEPFLLSDSPLDSPLREQARLLSTQSLLDLFREDPQRLRTFRLEAAGLGLDFSKHLLDRTALETLHGLAAAARLPERARALMAGESVNNTEHRPALHSLLRGSGREALPDLYREVTKTQARMRSWVQALNEGQHTGFGGQPMTDVLNIGIGGSDLGPRLVTEALQPYGGRLRIHYVANVDPADLEAILPELNPATTMVVVCSKSFRTEETLANSTAARRWLLEGGVPESHLARHVLAVTTNLTAAEEFGLPADNCLPLWDWVGGRYSIWSAVGISPAIGIGWDNFQALLDGAAAMDHHFASTTVSDNMPVLMSLLEVWYGNYFGATNHVVLPYDHSLRRLPDFLQQLTMESNGKRVRTDGSELNCPSAPVLWGSAGTLGQHSFHQLLHQGTQLCPADFVLPLTSHSKNAQQHRKLVANGLAQSRALMVGRSLAEATESLLERGHSQDEAQRLAPHLVMPGNRPSSVISMPSLTPHSLGALLALYEHRTFCSSQLWGINAFDQWGVELGKEIGEKILARLEGQSSNTLDPSTEQLIKAWKQTQ